MQYGGTLIHVADMAKAKHFYETVMEQKVAMDLGTHVSFEKGLSLQSNYAELVGVDFEMHTHPNNFQLYFEVDNLDHWQAKIVALGDIEIIHRAKEYPWGQRVLRFYDYDGHIVEVSESMTGVAKCFLAQGLSVEETATRTMFPVEFVETLQ